MNIKLNLLTNFSRKSAAEMIANTNLQTILPELTISDIFQFTHLDKKPQTMIISLTWVNALQGGSLRATLELSFRLRYNFFRGWVILKPESLTQ